jgi:hypothetical protein
VTAILSPLRSRLLFEMDLLVDPPHDLGGPAGAARRVGNIPGGTFTGERLRGTILPGGSDWQTLRSDGAVLLDARLLLMTDDGALIGMTYTGIRHGPPEIIASLAAGEPVSPEAYYFRTVPSFVTSDPRYEWLNRIVAIGIGHRNPRGPLYRIEEIL